MNAATFQHLFDTSGAFAHPATRVAIGVAGVGIGGALVLNAFLARSGKIDPALAKDIRTRTITWAIIAPLTLGMIVVMPLTAILAAAALALLSYREFARATGLFRERLISALVVLGSLGVTFAVLDHWRGLISGVQAVTLSLLCVLSVLLDSPKGYIQRVALGSAAFMLFGVGFQRLGLFAHDAAYRPILCSIFMCVQLNDVFAYCSGKFLHGKRKLFPNTSPNKTLAGHLGALLLTTPLAAFMFHLCFKGEALDQPLHLLAMALIVSAGGQLGDLVIGSVKRDVGVKDMGALLPGHGGVLDRCNSLLFVVPALYHYVFFVRGIGAGVPTRLFTGGIGEE